jgi:hypothetical protein
MDGARGDRSYRNALLLIAFAVFLSYVLIAITFYFSPGQSAQSLMESISFVAVTVGGLASLGSLVYQVTSSDFAAPTASLSADERAELRDAIEAEIREDMAEDQFRERLLVDEEELANHADRVLSFVRVDETGRVFLKQESRLTDAQRVLLYLLGRACGHHTGDIESAGASRAEIRERLGLREVAFAYAMDNLEALTDDRTYDFVHQTEDGRYRFEIKHVDEALSWVESDEPD